MLQESQTFSPESENINLEVLNKIPDYAKDNFDYFLGTSNDSAEYDKYKRLDIIPTNNLCLYMVDNPAAELAPGYPNPDDYRQKKFGFVIEGFKEEYPELWAKACGVMAAYCELKNKNLDLMFIKDKTDVIIQKMSDNEILLDELFLAKAEVCSDVFKIIAPQMKAYDIDPISICM